MANIAPAEKLKKISAKLPEMDYFQILNVQSTANDSDIKIAFRKRSISFHPDRYFNEPENQKQLAGTIYKQISLAYNSLKDPRHRKAYQAMLEKDREANLRFNPAKIRDFELDDVAEEKQTGPGAKYYQLAQASLAANDKRGALNNIKLALMMEAKNQVFLDFKSSLEKKK